MSSYSRAFTIVELLIVIVVIGILATITVTAFNGVQGRAKDTAVRSDLAGFMKAIELYKVTNGRFPGTPTDLELVSNVAPLRPSKSAYLTGASSNLGYCLSEDELDAGFVAKSSTNNAFYVTNKSGSVKSYVGPWDEIVRTACRDLSVIGLTADGTWGYSGGAQVWASWIK